MEVENEGKLPYLDTLVIRKENIIKIDWYQKPTSSGRIINFYSCQPKNIIMNTANNLIRRVLDISDEVFHPKNVTKVREILRNNAFPDDVIVRLFRNSKKKHEPREDKTSPTRIYKSMTYIPEISERIKSSDIYNKNNFTLAFSSTNTLKQLFSNTKSKIDKMDNHNVIYKIKCGGNNDSKCDQIYVGTTGNKLKTRIAGHKSDLKNINKNPTQKTALAAHCAEKHHKPELERVEILQREQKYNKRYTLEMLHIINIPKQRRINYKTDTENCANSYRHIINKKLK